MQSCIITRNPESRYIYAFLIRQITKSTANNCQLNHIPSLTCISDTTHKLLPRQTFPFKLTIFCSRLVHWLFRFQTSNCIMPPRICIVHIDDLQEICMHVYNYICSRNAVNRLDLDKSTPQLLILLFIQANQTVNNANISQSRSEILLLINQNK